MNKKISTPIGVLIILLITAAVIGIIIWACPEKETVSPIDETVLPIDETAGWKTYRNEEYGFEVKYPYYLINVMYDIESFKGFFPLESEEVFYEKIFSIDIKEEEYDQDTEYYCSQGIPHTSEAIIDGINFCEVRHYEDIENDTAIRRFSYFIIHNEKWVTLNLILSYCFSYSSLDNDCIVPSEFDISKEKGNFKKIISTFRFLEEE